MYDYRRLMKTFRFRRLTLENTVEVYLFMIYIYIHIYIYIYTHTDTHTPTASLQRGKTPSHHQGLGSHLWFKSKKYFFFTYLSDTKVIQ